MERSSFCCSSESSCSFCFRPESFKSYPFRAFSREAFLSAISFKSPSSCSMVSPSDPAWVVREESSPSMPRIRFSSSAAAFSFVRISKFCRELSRAIRLTRLFASSSFPLKSSCSADRLSSSFRFSSAFL